MQNTSRLFTIKITDVKIGNIFQKIEVLYMNEFMNEMERRYGRYAIKNLTVYIIGIYVIGFILALAPDKFNVLDYLVLDPYLIMHGQIWRLVSWVFLPTLKLDIWVLITLYLYYFIGTTMERTIGTFRYNVFIFGGIIFTVIAAFLCYGFYALTGASGNELIIRSMQISVNTTTHYLQMATFLIFALIYPNLELLFMFIIPIKVKYFGIVYSAFIIFNFISTGIIGQNYIVCFLIGAQMVNLLIFYLSTGKLFHLRPKQVKRRAEFKKNVRMTPPGIARHKCAVCGRTNETNPELEFRFCSKCNGNYEYCQDHLFTHEHIK